MAEDTGSALAQLAARISTIEENMRITMDLFSSGINRSDIREAFLIEIIREAGLLEDADLDKVADSVRQRFTGENTPWSPRPESSEANLNRVLGEISGVRTTD